MHQWRLGGRVGILGDELSTAAVRLDHLRQQPEYTGLGHQWPLLLLILTDLGLLLFALIL